MWTPPVAVVVLLVLVSFCDRALIEALHTNFSFSRFEFDDGRVLKIDDTSFNGMLYSYDMNHRASKYGPEYGRPCARILYKDAVRMRDRASSRVASFNTSFTFAFASNRNSIICRAGMAFTFAANNSLTATHRGNRSGAGMCTFDYADKSASNRVLAVKFDSSFDEFSEYPDPSDSSIGVVISSRGNTRVSQFNLCGTNTTRCNYFCREQGNFTAWIDYDSVGESLEVRFQNGSLASAGKPADAVLRVSNVSLDESVLEQDHMYVGFSASARESSELADIHQIKAWNFTSSGLATPASHELVVAEIIGGICAAAAGAILVAVLAFFILKRRQKRFSEKLEQLTLDLDDDPRAFTYGELSKITKKFDYSELLSAGAFGDVYKGTLPSGALVAVKRIKPSEEQEGEESFLAEATSLRQIRHRNLLQLRGWCRSKEGLLLVYDYMSRGSLDKWLHPSPRKHDGGSTQIDREWLPWNLRHFILAGVASGLKYLHEEWVQCVLHRDVKSSNVLLDGDFNAYLGDFGLARMLDHQKLEKTTLLAGTLGYMAPEMQYTGRATKETDVYAFGMLVLEVVCGRRPLEVQGVEQEDNYLLLDVVWRAHEAGNLLRVADPKLSLPGVRMLNVAISEGLYDMEPGTRKRTGALEDAMTVAKTLHVGLLCCLPSPSERPPMRLVNQWFQSCEVDAMELPPLPATKSYVQYSVPHSSAGTGSSKSLPATHNSYQTSTSSKAPASKEFSPEVS